MIKLNDEVNPDEDLDVSKIFSMNLKILCFQYENMFFGTDETQHENSVHFFDERKRYFFSFTDAVCNIPGEPAYLTKEERSLVDEDFYVFAPILQAIYCLKDWRGYGLQKEIIDSLKDVSDETGEPIVAVADPFIINKSCYENNVQHALYRLMVNGYRRPSNWRESVIKQCDKFLDYGFENFVLPNAVITKPFQQFIYLPESAPAGTKLAIRSLQRNKALFTRDVVDSMPINVKY